MATKPTKTADLKKAPNKATTAVAVRPSNAVASIKDQLAAQAAAMAGRTAPPTGSKIRTTQDKKFVLPTGQTVPGPLTLCIVDFTTVHKFYEGKYDPKNITPPACFAIGTNPKDMTPSPNSPNKQAPDCQSCPMNAFGSDGDGKACKNGRLLAVLPANDAGDDVDHEADMWTIEVSPTALKGFDGYVQGLARSFGSPPVGFLTEVSFDESVTYAKLVFSNPVPVNSVAQAFARQAEAQEMLNTEPDVSTYGKPAAGRAPARKAAPGRR